LVIGGVPIATVAVSIGGLVRHPKAGDISDALRISDVPQEKWR
jgi:hypothetical protein